MAESDTVGQPAYDDRDWATAYGQLTDADADAVLDAAGLERLAVAATMTGHDEAAFDAYERAHRAWLDAGEPARAARTAFWLGMALIDVGDTAQAGGWFARASSVLDEDDLDTVERGFLLVPAALRAMFSSDGATALELFTDVHRYASRDGDPDLNAMSRLGRGMALVTLGRLDEGVALLDEAMLAVTTGELSPQLSGTVYCAVIDVCLAICDLSRAEEWTRSLTTWCSRQPGLVPFRGQCLVDRAELLHLRGEWDDAVAQVVEAKDLFASVGHPAFGRACYVQGEIARVRGDSDAAEAAYRAAAEHGHDPHPGLALLWLQQGRVEEALAASRRVVGRKTTNRDRVQYLAAHVDICLAAADLEAAETAVDELRAIASTLDAPMLRAVTRRAEGALLLARDEPLAADRPLREALALWLEISAPLDAAATRVSIAEACHRLGDLDTAELELETAAATFRALGAGPRLAAVEELQRTLDAPATTAAAGGLTGRELEVLREVASGKTNRDIAETLVISEKTVSRHLSNIFTKLDVSSRAAATAYAYTHDLV